MSSIPTTSRICLAVLPFEVLTEHPNAEMFCQGLVMDVISDLSGFRSLNIIAYDSSRTLSGAEADDLVRDMHVDYLVKGLARYRSGHLQINVQLVNVHKSSVVWGERFAGDLDDLFRIQGEIVQQIVLSLQSFVDHDVLDQVRRKPLTDLTAYESWLRGYRQLKEGTVEADEQARIYFRQALAVDPNYARAYTGMSLSYFNEWSCQLWSRWEISQSGAGEWAKMALDHDEWDHVSNAILGRVLLFGGEFDGAEHFLRKSLRINMNDPETLALISSAFVYLGFLDEALDLYRRAQRLNPANSFAAFGVMVHFERGEYDEAMALFEHYGVSESTVDFPAIQAAICYYRGDLDQMQAYWREYLDVFSAKINGGQPVDSQTALEWTVNMNPFRVESRAKAFWEYMSEIDLTEVAAKKAPPRSEEPNRLVKEGDLWAIRYRGVEARLPDLKGLHDLVRLLGKPGQSIHCTELMGAQTIAGGQPALDDKAKSEYQRRIRDLQEDIRDAESRHDDRQLETLQEEYEQLIDHLAQSVGKGGKARKVDGTVEKCRTAVTWRIRSTLKKISEVHPAMGTHLTNSVKTGVFCEYSPEHDNDWVL